MSKHGVAPAPMSEQVLLDEIERLRADNADLKRTLDAPIPWLLERDLRGEIERLRAVNAELLAINAELLTVLQAVSWGEHTPAIEKAMAAVAKLEGRTK
jgi:hypothetical protein